MDKEFKTTFIPKKAVAKNDSAPLRSRAYSKRAGLLGVVAFLLFITAIVSAGGIFFYQSQIKDRINQKVTMINDKDNEFDSESILELRKLDIRLNAAKELLDGHIVVSEFLENLGASTLPEVGFSNFSFTVDDSEGIASVSVTGRARRFENIAQQSDILDANRYVENHIFSDFSLDDTGFVNFSLVFTVNSEEILFGRNTDLPIDLEVEESGVTDVDINSIGIPSGSPLINSN